MLEHLRQGRAFQLAGRRDCIFFDPDGTLSKREDGRNASLARRIGHVTDQLIGGLAVQSRYCAVTVQAREAQMPQKKVVLLYTVNIGIMVRRL